ncbi:hypothetical protein PCANC_05354 [Puccinia coronata f. sp. avenae]|uniref:Uncharacterized protein n=1 Tax=Puccinia coronata f. sp. avenae TaxID=200324 RepID=A0A2N5VXC9_9BASI|nr:hypothetical protein PCASD_09390 [Puccinia coronata f. sp. avenae]PLW54641.1 hypothetical protein PCANC_05354 [Puccinia coronata f. sp. avenae]
MTPATTERHRIPIALPTNAHCPPGPYRHKWLDLPYATVRGATPVPSAPPGGPNNGHFWHCGHRDPGGLQHQSGKVAGSPPVASAALSGHRDLGSLTILFKLTYGHPSQVFWHCRFQLPTTQKGLELLWKGTFENLTPQEVLQSCS